MKKKLYQELFSEIKALIKDVDTPISNYANVAAAIYNTLPDINWAGFYFSKNNNLILGPFQGKPACVKIPFGRGVCGTAINNSSTLIVDDVHVFPGHIACDPSSRSEIVIPMIKDKVKIGVLDIDSPKKDRFDKIDQEFFQKIVALLIN
ncbi:MAG: GAF domain-containing protein [Candidatus Neomarinimicrobiota bacterium]